MANPAPTINQINAFNATQGTTIDFNIIGGTELIRSNRIYIYDLSDNSLICTHLYVSTESIHELPPNTDGSIVYESGKSSADFVNGAQYYAQIQTYTDTNGTQGGSGLSVAKMFWCLGDPTLTITTIPSTISTTSYNISATYTDTSASVVSNIIQQYQFNLYSATGSLLQSSGVVVGNGTQQGTSDVYDISYNFTGLNVGSSYYVTVNVTTTQGMSVNAQSNTFTVSIDTPTLGEATVVNNACDGYISVTSNLSGEYGGSGSGEIVSFETDSENVFSKLQVDLEPIQEGSGTPSPSNVRPIRGHSGVTVYDSPAQNAEDGESYSVDFNVSLTPTSTDTTPYLFKAVGDVYGDRLEDKIVGGTVAWNQLVKQRESPLTKNGVTSTYNTDGTVTLSGTVTSSYAETYDPISLVANHIYLLSSIILANPNNISFVVRPLNIPGGAVVKNTLNSSRTNYGISRVTSGTDLTGIKFKSNFFDLTQMFGSTIADYIYSLEQSQEGAGVAWFKKLFPNDYYAYNAGELLSVEGLQRHDVVGFNQFDKNTMVVEGVYIDNDNGAEKSEAGALSADFIPVIPNATYFINTEQTAGGWGAWYDANKNYISGITGYVGVDPTHKVKTAPNNAHYMRLTCKWSNNGNVDTLCINLSNPTRNGEYEPYEKHSYPLDSSLTLRGIPKLDASNNLYYDGDEYTSDGKVKRKYGVVDLGTLDWYGSAGLFYAIPANFAPPSSYTARAEGFIFSNKYSADTQIAIDVNKMADKTALRLAGRIYIKDTSYTDAATFKEAMSGVMLVYELATPTTETATPYTNPQIVSKYGTLEYVTNSIVPVGHKTTYLTRDIFGGYVDLISGKLVVTYKGVNLGDLTWESRESTGGTGLFVGRMPTDYKWASSVQAICSSYEYKGYIGSTATALATLGNDGCGLYWNNTVEEYDYPFLYICNEAFAGNTGEQVKSAMNGVQLVYELATPQTYQLTPQQVNTLVGTNSVWSEQGNIELSYHIPITNLLVKRQDVDDVGGGWLTLYSQPISQASDMDFTFIDFLNQYGKTYKYALVPLLTQTQSGVEVEVEGGYTVSNEVQSVFDGVFIADSTGSQKCKANVGYGNVDMNQVVGSITPIGAKYPIIVTNSHNQYHNGSISGTIVPDDYYFNGNLSRIDMVKKRNELEQFLTNKRVKVIKDWNGNIWLVMIMGNVSCTFNNTYGMGIVDFSTNWTEVGDPTNQEDLQATGLINVGGV